MRITDIAVEKATMEELQELKLAEKELETRIAARYKDLRVLQMRQELEDKRGKLSKRDQIIYWYVSGKKPEAIVYLAESTRGAVDKVICEYKAEQSKKGIDAKSKGELTRDKVLQYKAAKLTPPMIAQELGITRQQVYNILKQDKILRDRVLSMFYKDKTNKEDIAKQLKVSYDCVNQIIREDNGVSIKMQGK